MKIAFAGSFAVRLAEPVRARLSIPCEAIADDETKIVAQLADTDILVSMGFTQEMATAGPRLRLVQVPGAGLDRIDRHALRPDTHLARRCTKAAVHALMAKSCFCCSRATNGYEAAAPPSSVMNSRRLIRSPRRR